MSEWNIIYSLFDIAPNSSPDAWEIIGVDRDERDLRVILVAFEERKRVLAAGVVGQRQAVLVRKFQQEILVPAFNKVCTAAESDWLEGSDAEDAREDVVDDKAGSDFESIDVADFNLDSDEVNSESSAEYIDAVEFLKPEEEPIPVENSEDGKGDGAIPFLAVAEEDDASEDDSGYELAKKTVEHSKEESGDHEVPVLIDAERFVPELEASQQLRAIQDSMDESFSGEELDSYVVAEVDEEIPDVTPPAKKKKLGSEKFILYFIAVIPFIALGIFAIVLINLDPEGETANESSAENVAVVDENAELVSTERHEENADVDVADESQSEENVKVEEQQDDSKKLSLGLKPVEVPVRFSFLADEVKQSFSDGSKSVEVLEDIAVVLKAWQFIVQNAPDTEGYVTMLQNDRHRNQADAVFDLKAAGNDYLNSLLSEPDSSIEFPVEFFQEEFDSGENDRIWCAIELAGISGSTALQDYIFSRLADEKDPELVSRMVRAICLWSSATEQMAMFDLVNSARRDLCRKIFSNLLMRYEVDPLASGAYESLLPYSFTSRDLDKTLEWWKSNLLKLQQQKLRSQTRVNYGRQQQTEMTDTAYHATVLAVVWKNSIELSAALRNSREMPLLSPDMEINNSISYPVNQVLFRSVKQVADGLLAVMYDEFSAESFLEDLDILRFKALEYEFGDVELRAPFKAEEVSIYCDLISGGEFSGKFSSNNIDQKKSMLLQVRDDLFDAMNKYAASTVVDYGSDFTGDVASSLNLDYDFELNNEYQLVNETEEKVKKLLEEFRAEPFSAEKFNEVRYASYLADMQGKAGLAYLQLAIKALQSENSTAGGAIAIECFRKAMKWPESRGIMKKHVAGLYESLLQDPDFHCSFCGDTGYRLCPECDGSIFVRCQECRGYGAVTVRLEGRVTCPDCDGYGKVPCWECGGTGVVACLDCYDYLISQELFLPNDETLKEIQQEINLATLQVRVSVEEK